MSKDVDFTELIGILNTSKELLRSGYYLETKAETEKLEKNIAALKKTHRRAFDAVSFLEIEIENKKRQGYDVEEASNILTEARRAFGKLDYEKTFSLVQDSKQALERSLYLPFPLLDKDVRLISVIKKEDSEVVLKFQLVNHMETSLGEILLNLSTPPGFIDLREKKLGFIGPREKRTIKAVLKPTIYQPELGFEGDNIASLIFKNKITLKSKLDCSGPNPTYKISVKNVGNEVITDLILRPMVPDALESEQDKKMIAELRPIKSVSTTFQLYPKKVEKMDAEIAGEEEEEAEEEEEKGEVAGEEEAEEEMEEGEEEVEEDMEEGEEEVEEDMEEGEEEEEMEEGEEEEEME
ncbi:MAG: hypothetical protein R6U17_01515, partial [Thermoplasmata archaeon]